MPDALENSPVKSEFFPIREEEEGEVYQRGDKPRKNVSIRKSHEESSGQYNMRVGEDSLMQDFESLDNSQVRIPQQLFDKSMSVRY